MNQRKRRGSALWHWCLSLTLVWFATTVFAQTQVRDEATNVTVGATNDEPLGLGDGIDVNLVRRGGDDFKSPQAAKQFKLRQEALRQRIAGKGRGKIHEVAKGQYVELGLERNDRIFVIIVEYGDSVGLATPPLSTVSGPRHNEIPQPDRSEDNNTIRQPDYDRAHYETCTSRRCASSMRSSRRAATPSTAR